MTEISSKLIWTLQDSTLVLRNDDLPIPKDLVEELVGSQSQDAFQIEANWELDEQAQLLHLSKIQLDGIQLNQEVDLKIRPASQIRVNLGTRQYNISGNDGKQR